MSISMCMSMCAAYVYAYVYVYVYLYMSMSVSTCVSICMYVYTYIWLCIYICVMRACVRACVCVCKHDTSIKSISVIWLHLVPSDSSRGNKLPALSAPAPMAEMPYVDSLGRDSSASIWNGASVWDLASVTATLIYADDQYMTILHFKIVHRCSSRKDSGWLIIPDYLVKMKNIKLEWIRMDVWG